MPKRKQGHKKPSPSDRKPKVCQYCGDFVNSSYYGKHGPKLTECYGRSMPRPEIKEVFVDILNTEDPQPSDEFPETHWQGYCTLENLEFVQEMNLADCDVGVQIGWDGRVWVCINGVAIIRFKPHNSKGKM